VRTRARSEQEQRDSAGGEHAASEDADRGNVRRDPRLVARARILAHVAGIAVRIVVLTDGGDPIRRADPERDRGGAERHPPDCPPRRRSDSRSGNRCERPRR